MVLWVPDPSDVYLDGHKLIFTRQQVVQEGMLHGFSNFVPKLALRKCPKPVKCPMLMELLAIGVV